jgi:hypothetical protein
MGRVWRGWCVPQSREQGDTHFPEDYAASLAARAVAGTNAQPCRERLRAFKGISKSKLHAAAKARAATSAALRQALRLATGLDTQSHPSATRDVLPYLKFFGPSARGGGDGTAGAIAPGASVNGAEGAGASAPPVEEIDEF